MRGKVTLADGTKCVSLIKGMAYNVDDQEITAEQIVYVKVFDEESNNDAILEALKRRTGANYIVMVREKPPLPLIYNPTEAKVLADKETQADLTDEEAEEVVRLVNAQHTADCKQGPTKDTLLSTLDDSKREATDFLGFESSSDSSKEDESEEVEPDSKSKEEECWLDSQTQQCIIEAHQNSSNNECDFNRYQSTEEDLGSHTMDNERTMLHEKGDLD